MSSPLVLPQGLSPPGETLEALRGHRHQEQPWGRFSVCFNCFCPPVLGRCAGVWFTDVISSHIMEDFCL